MKILFFINKIGGGGRERRMSQLVHAFDKIEGIEMMAVVSSDQVDYKDIFSTKINVKVVDNSSPLQRLKMYCAIVKDYRPNIIHLWIETSMYCILLPILSKLYKSKMIAGFVADANTLDSRSLFSRMAIRFSFLFSDIIISNSVAGLKAKKTPLRKSVVIYNGFDRNRLPCKINVGSKKGQLGIKEDFLVTMCGRVTSAKDWDMFVALAEKVNSKRNDVFFLAVGDGDNLEYFRDVIIKKQLNNIRFVGRRSDIEEILAASAVSVLFTNNEKHAEGVSNSIMESMAVGVPVIATQGGGTAEIITSGYDGYIIEPHNVQNAYNRLIELLDDVRKRMVFGSNSQKTIEERFALDDMGKKYLEVYNNLLNK